MDSHHRKIDLQSASDLTYLLNNIRAAAQEKIDLAIPRSAAPQGEDAYRTKVEELVQDYILRSLTLALPSLTINGFDPSPSLLLLQTSASAGTTTASSNETSSSSNNNTHDSSSSHLSDAEIAAGNYDAYDPRLAERLRSLYIQFEQESESVAKMRRTAPQKAAQAYAERLRGDMDGQEGGGVKLEEGWHGEHVPLEGGTLERPEEVERMWRRGLEGLEGLGDITEVRARLERAEKATDVVEGL